MSVNICNFARVNTFNYIETMTTLQLNAEIYEALSIIAQDESLLKKAAL